MKNIVNKIFSIKTEEEFNALALKVFNFQAKNNLVYKTYINHLGLNVDNIKTIEEIPFLPIEFFKTHKVVSGVFNNEKIFTSSGTTGENTSKHFIRNISIYKQSFTKGFNNFYNNISDYYVLALLPSYLEREGSSLVYMMNNIIENSNPESGFYIKNQKDLYDKIIKLRNKNKKILLIGVSYALMDFAEKYKPDLSNCIVMETGGMKGKRQELTKKELHSFLHEKFNVSEIHSEYGMTELLSQAYSSGKGIYRTQPWMKVLVRDIYDPFSYVYKTQKGGLNIIDLANVYSCSFIETKDLGAKHSKNEFEITGRFDNSDIRGCNLLIQ